MEFQDKDMVCVECKQPWVLTARDQSFICEKFGADNYNEPKRCVPCRKRRRENKNGHQPRQR